MGAQNRPEKRPKYCIDLMKCMVECKINTYIEKVQHKKTNPCMKPLLMCFFLSFKLSRKGILIIKVFHVWFSAYQMEGLQHHISKECFKPIILTADNSKPKEGAESVLYSEDSQDLWTQYYIKCFLRHLLAAIENSWLETPIVCNGGLGGINIFLWENSNSIL